MEIPDFDLNGKESQRISFSGEEARNAASISHRKRHLINADINGAANIGRKELGDEWLEKTARTRLGASLWTRPQLYETCMNV